MFSSRFFRASSIVLTLVFLQGVSKASIIQNGSFENPVTLSGPGPNTGQFAGDISSTCSSIVSPCISVPGWSSNFQLAPNNDLPFYITTGSGGNASSLLDGGGSIPAADGSDFVGVDGSFGTLSPISQTLSGLTVGQSYVLSFDQAAAELSGNNASTVQQWIVTIGGIISGSPTPITLPDSSTLNAYPVLTPDYQWTTPLMSIGGGGFSGWQPESYSFTANSATELLAFLGVGAPQGPPPIILLDNVSVDTGAAPEPVSLAMVFLGLVIIATLAHLRNAARKRREAID